MTAQSAGPYAAELPRDDKPPAGYMTAADHLADALQGTAPALSKQVEYKLGKQETLALADAIRRAIALAVRHHADDIAAAELDRAAELYRERLRAAPDLLVERFGAVTRRG